MAELRQAKARGGPYERLLQHLALALEEAESAACLQQAVPVELELRDLTLAELELIRAYLNCDLNWLRGWHAAAEEMALIEQPGAAQGKALPARGKSASKKRQPLCCALCGTVVSVRRSEVLPCPACGSRLFRVGQLG